MCQNFTGGGINLGSNDHFGEQVDDLLRRFSVKGAVQGDDAAESAFRIAGQCLQVSFFQRSSLGDTAWIGVFDDCAGSIVELGDQLECGVRIVQVVEAQLLALQLIGRRNTGAGIAIGVEGGFLMRVFAITHGLLAQACKSDALRQGVVQLAREPAADRGVIGAGSGIGSCRQLFAKLIGGRPAICLYFFHHLGVVSGVDDNRYKGMIFGRSADQGGAADVDIFDAVVESCALGNGFLEWIKIDRQKIYGRDVVLFHRRLVFSVAAHCKQAAVDGRLQSLDPAIHDFWKTSMFGNLDNRDTGVV